MLLAAASSANGGRKSITCGRESMTISGLRGKSGGTNNGKTAIFQAANFLATTGFAAPSQKSEFYALALNKKTYLCAIGKTESIC